MNKYKLSLIICLIVVVFIVGGAIAARQFMKKSGSSTGGIFPSVKKSESLATSSLDGKSYPADKASRHPLAVIIENHPDARPQYGVSKASLVYEAITEGGITRYLTIYGPNDAPEIGPIRSARLFFMDYLKEYDAFFAHAGGNEDALDNIDNYSIKDLNHSQNYFWRDRKGKSVASEHTLYSSTDKLYEYASSKKYDINTSSFEAMKFKTAGPASTEGKSIEIDFSTASYKVRWSYSPTTNNYLRFLAGKEDVDSSTREQLKADNVVIQEVSRKLNATGNYGGENWVMQTVGSGKATVYQDGKTIDATWKKPSRDSRTLFYDPTGAQISFNPGVTWYEIVPPSTPYKAI